MKGYKNVGVLKKPSINTEKNRLKKDTYNPAEGKEQKNKLIQKYINDRQKAIKMEAE